jgi:hypothetical protein
LIFVKGRLPRHGIAQRVRPKPEANVPDPAKNRPNFRSVEAGYLFVRLNDSSYAEIVPVMVNQRDIGILCAGVIYHFDLGLVVAMLRMSKMGQSLQTHSGPKRTNVRFAPLATIQGMGSNWRDFAKRRHGVTAHRLHFICLPLAFSQTPLALAYSQRMAQDRDELGT